MADSRPKRSVKRRSRSCEAERDETCEWVECSHGTSTYPSAKKPRLPENDAKISKTGTSSSEGVTDPVGASELTGTVKDNALRAWPRLSKDLAGKKLAVFLDYDGTLTPIVSNPSDAILTDEMRSVVDQLSRRFDTAIVTGRGISTIVDFVKLDRLYYAGSHGFDIRAPGNVPVHQVAASFLPSLKSFYKDISEALKAIPGALVEDNGFSVSVHFRNVNTEQACADIEAALDELLLSFGGQLCKRLGKKVFEIRPQFDWHKGKAVSWLLDQVFKPKHEGKDELVPVYLGDDWTDEDAFKTLCRENGKAYGVFVRLPSQDRPTAASLVLDSTAEVQAFLTKLCQLPTLPDHEHADTPIGPV